MKLKRLYDTLRMISFRSDSARSRWLKKHDVFDAMGENVSINMKLIPLYPKLIRFHNNIKVATGVTFVTHDVIHMVLNRCRDYQYDENMGCIEIMDNVFIGARSVIMPNVRIGPNAIVAAGAVITKDVPPGEIWGGVPAIKIGTFDAYCEKYKLVCEQKKSFPKHGDNVIGDDRANEEWAYFERMHRKAD